MIGDNPVEARLNCADFHNVCEKAHQLMAFIGEALRTRLPLRIIFEEFGIVARHHAAARARGRDDIIAWLKRFDHLLRKALRIALVARIESGLTATGLFRHHDFAACLFQQMHSGKADGRAEEIDKTGGEQADKWLGLGQCSILND